MLSGITIARRDNVGRSLRVRRSWFDGEATDEQAAQVSQPADAQASEQSFDWASVKPTDLPDELITQHPLYRRVLDEAVERRKKIRELTEDKQQRTTPEPAEKPQQPDANEMPAWAQQLVQQMQSVQGFIQQSQQESIEVRRQAALQEYGLPQDAAVFLNGNDPGTITQQAATLAKMFNLPKASAGGADDATSFEGIGARALSLLQSNVDPLSAPGIFDLGVQRQHKGGSIK